MALCLSSFNHYLGRRQPKLLLLDEVDAVLHPSMVAALVATLKSVFVADGTKVLMTSHSPMTVASLAEADIFRVVREDGHVEVRRSTKVQAIDELSEGLATVDAGLKIASFDNTKVTLLTEGNNTLHLKKWVQLNFSEGVQVFEELPRHRSSGQLRAYARFLARVNTNTHFVIVWDCDAADEAERLQKEVGNVDNVTPYVFRRRGDNGIVRSGIENNYDERFLEPFSIKKVDSDERVLGWEFPKNRKTKFAEHVWQLGTADYFNHFEGLRAVVSKILG